MTANPSSFTDRPHDETDIPGQTLMFKRDRHSEEEISVDEDPALIVINPTTDVWAPLDTAVDIGRAIDCQLRFRDDAFMTHRAARIEPDGPAVTPSDEDAYVWIRVRTPTPLRHGDELVVGSTHLVVTTKEGAFDGDPSPRH